MTYVPAINWVDDSPPDLNAANLITEFANAANYGAAATGGTAGGDLTGSYPNPTIASSAVTNAKVSASAAIAYSKLALSNGIVNGDINTAAAIAYSKLALTGAIVNADVNASAAIAYSKLNLATSIVLGDIAGTLKPSGSAAAGDESLRALGTSSSTACAGNDSRLTDSRAPNGSAGGSLTGTYPNPTLAGRTLAALTSDVGPISAQTTLQNVTGLSLTIGASATEQWIVRYLLLVNSANGTMDIKVGFTVPATCTMLWGFSSRIATNLPGWGGEAVGSGVNVLNTESSVQPSGTSGTVGGTIGVAFTAMVFSGGTGGTVQIQYAQNTSDAGNLKILKGSTMEATRVVT